MTERKISALKNIGFFIAVCGIFFLVFFPNLKTVADTTPNVVSAVVNGNTLVLTLDEPVNQNAAQPTDFTLGGAGYGGSVSSFSIQGSVITLTLGGSVMAGETITLNYNNAGNGIADVNTGNSTDYLNTFGGLSVTNNTPLPTVSSAVINGALLTITFDETIQNSSIPDATDFVVNVNSNPVSISSVNIGGSDSNVVITLASAVSSTDSVDVSYTVGSHSIFGTTGAVASFSNQSVTNNSSIPTVSSKKIKGDTVTLVYNTNLDGSSVPDTTDFVLSADGTPKTISHVDVSGTTVTLTLAAAVSPLNTITLSYTSGINPLRDSSFNTAQNFSELSVPNLTEGCTITIPGVSPGPYTATLVGTKLYVNSPGITTVAVIDTTTDTLLRNISVGQSPSSSYLVGTKLYVLTSNPDIHASSTLAVIDTTNDTVVKTIQLNTTGVGGRVSMVFENGKFFIFGQSRATPGLNVVDTASDTVVAAINGAFSSIVATKGKVYVQSGNTDVKVISAVTNSVIKTITGVATFGGYNMTVVGDRIYTMNGSSNDIGVIDTLTDTLVSPSIYMSLANGPYSSVLYGTKLYVNAYLDTQLPVIDVTNNSILHTITVGSSTYAFNTIVGNYLYTSNNNDGSVSVVDLSTDTVVKTIGVGNGPSYSTIAGKKLYVMNSNDDHISVIDTVTRTAEAICGNAPNLTSFTSTTASGTYGSGQSINITANFDQALSGGSMMTVHLNSGANVTLNNVSGTTLSGTYVVGSGDATPDLAVTSISGESVADLSGHTRTNYSSYPLPSSPGNLTAENSDLVRNIGDSKNIVIGSYVAIPVGTNPYQVSPKVTVGGVDYVYVANQGSGTVSVVRTSDNTVVQTIIVGTEPYGLSTATIGGVVYVYVANTGSDTVSAIDTSTNTVAATISVGLHPYYVATIGTNIYVTNGLSNTVSVIDGTTNTVSATVGVGTYPRGIKAHGTDLYVANYGNQNYGGGDSVTVINSLNNTVTKTILLAGGSQGPRGVTVLGSKVYVADYLSDTVSVIDTGTNAVVDTVHVGKGPRGMTVLGSYIYVENFDEGTISVIDSSNDSVVQTIFVGHSPAGMGIVGTNIYFSRFSDNALSILNTTNNTLLPLPETQSDSNNESTTTTTVARPGGRSGGGGSSYVSSDTSTTVSVQPYSVSTLQGIVQKLLKELISLAKDKGVPVSPDIVGVTVSPIASTTEVIIFTHSLTYRDIDPEVKDLQRYLNSHGFQIAPSGPGSKGFETEKFGIGTYNALIKFQRSVNLSGSGYFGPKTIEYVNSHP